MFTKKTLMGVLPAALLFAGASAFAQNNVKLGNGTETTWAEVVKALNGTGADLDALTQAVTDAKNKLDRTEPKTETKAVEWLETEQKAANEFLTAYNEYATSETPTATGTIYYKLVRNNLTKKDALTIGFTAGGGLTEASIATFAGVLYPEGTAPVISSLSIYLGATNGTNNYDANNGCYQLTSYTAEQQDNIVAIAVDALNNTLPSLKAFQTTGPTGPYKTALEELEAAEKALTDAQDAQKAYNTITLTNNVTVTEAIASYAGTIIGNYYTFTTTDAAVFTKFTGELSSAAVDGTFAVSSRGASFDNVALWNGTTGTLYDGNGVATEYTDFGELAFAGRNVFGVENGKLTKVTANNKVYSISVYYSATGEPTPYYATAANGKYTSVDGSAITVGDNVFVKSATGDLNGTNVIYNGTAKKVVITDGVDFFCPEDITSDDVTYTRSFTAGYNAVCLPFAISDADIDATLSTFDGAEAAKDGKFWFTLTSGEIAAYTPILMVAKEGSNLNLSGKSITIKKTDDQVVTGANGSFGTMKTTTVQEFKGASKANTVYGLANGKFQVGAETTKIPAFRMVISTEAPVATASRSIGFRDAWGNEVNIEGTTAIETVDSDAATFEVAGGNGEITINSSADCGNVAVYAMDGRVAANAYVTAGATTVNVPTGLYIVNGKKVVVK